MQITGLPEADDVLNQHPFALLVGMLLDQQYPMEHAFRGGWKIRQRFGSLDPVAIAAADPEQFAELCATPPAIHRYPKAMAARVQELAAVIASDYGGDADAVWRDAATGGELLQRLASLPGYGEQKSRIFVAFLAKQLGVRPEGWAEVAGDYALDGYRSVADVVDADSLRRVREFKKAKKAKG